MAAELRSWKKGGEEEKAFHLVYIPARKAKEKLCGNLSSGESLSPCFSFSFSSFCQLFLLVDLMSIFFSLSQLPLGRRIESKDAWGTSSNIRSLRDDHPLRAIHALKLDVLISLLVILLAGSSAEPRVHATPPQPTAHVLPPLTLPSDQSGRGVDLEAVAARHVALYRLGGDEGGVDLEDDVVEGGAKVRAVDGGVAGRLGVVNVLAASAVQLNGLDVGNVGEAHGEERV